ncbi:hypothetical protein A8E25_30140 [Burkholderia cenocepacia]|jgi:hypothetical protein|nr:hypothetical protein NP88_240 [Burkholderia cepacia]ONR58778.1 hypothetical protein A8E17_15845 [Burkholderia cenocepacia]ONR59750.1 hypothetical protein A8E23_34235 [Burkholderia cenocepacia]ONR60900.1 hypothetical protein A8E18_37105 [Burkholderia cenocepacia]ONR80651.1 hypothetical protein A8E22_15990 [Burkholderia cenocepacia]
MELLNVQFSDDTETSIISVFNCPQDPLAWPHQGQVSLDDPRYHAYFSSVPEALLAGLPEPIEGQSA